MLWASMLQMYKMHTMFPDSGESSRGSLRDLPVMVGELTPEPVQLKCPIEEMTLCEQVSSDTASAHLFQKLNR